MNPADTIAAVSSPPGRSWRGMIRIAGPDAARIAQSLLHPDPHTNADAEQREASGTPRALTHARLRQPNLPVLAAFFPGPASYTADDTLELQVPGNPALLERILQSCFNAGARPAQPGEFTFRAWNAGKLDLLQAEGVASLISARSDSQLAAAHQLRTRKLGKTTDRHAATLTDLLALVEAGIDFTDQEDVVPIAPATLHQQLRTLQASLQNLLARSRAWSQLDALPQVVIAGPPSAGKSSLFNALLGHPRAVTDALPGTTRDVIEEPWQLAPGHEVLLADLAGLDDHAAPLDAHAQHLARQAIARADLILWLGPANTPPNQPHITLQSRADLTPTHATPTHTLHISAVTGQGLETLRQRVLEKLHQHDQLAAADTLTLQPRHAAALQAAADALATAHEQIDPADHALHTPELVALHLRDALDALGNLVGHVTPDDVIGRVFATFCIGK